MTATTTVNLPRTTPTAAVEAMAEAIRAAVDQGVPGGDVGTYTVNVYTTGRGLRLVATVQSNRRNPVAELDLLRTAAGIFAEFSDGAKP